MDELQAKFSHIITKIKSAFRKKVKENSQISIEISNWVGSYLHWEHGTVDNDLDDIFKKIYHYYDFIDCSLIVAMCNEFISDENNLLVELKAYSVNANAFRSSEPIIELKQKLRKVYGPYRRHLENMPLICIELQNPWNYVKIAGLRILVGNLLPNELRQSLMKSITIEPGSVIIKLHIYDSTADSLIEYTGGKLQFMSLIGIFSLYINDHPVLQEDENMNFTFELALLEAVTAGNNEAVEFLLQLETVNIDHTNEEGKTALMLACERGQEDIVHSLLSAGANVNVKDNSGVTALQMTTTITLRKLFTTYMKPDVVLLNQWVEPLVDWQSFGLLLPGITHQDITTIEQLSTEHQKFALFSKWLSTNPTATWRDVLNALTKREEINLLQTINDQLQVHVQGMIIL